MDKPSWDFSPLPVAEAERLKNWLAFPSEFSALDPCVGDGSGIHSLASWRNRPSLWH